MVVCQQARRYPQPGSPLFFSSVGLNGIPIAKRATVLAEGFLREVRLANLGVPQVIYAKGLMMYRLLMTGLLVLGSCPLLAAPLDPSEVPKEAKWVLHVDFDALSDAKIVETLQENKPEMVKKARKWMEERYGITPQEDLKGLTLFSDTYEAHTGAAVLSATYDRDKVESKLKSKSESQQTKWKDYTLYTCKKISDRNEDKEGKRDKEGKQDKGSKKDKQSTTKCECDCPCEKCTAARKHSKSDEARKSVTVVLVDRRTIVFAPDEERAKSVVKLLEGDADSLKGTDSDLLGEMPSGVVAYGAAIQLNKLGKRSTPFPILEQHKRVSWVLGSDNGELFERFELEANNQDVAGKMKKAVEGFIALARVWAGDIDELEKMYEQTEVKQDDTCVTVNWQGETADLASVLSALKERYTAGKDSERKNY